jgi:hypothetical protein
MTYYRHVQSSDTATTGFSAPAADAAVDAVLTASRTLVAVSEQSPGGAAEATTLRPAPGAGRAGLSGFPAHGRPGWSSGVTPSTSGRMCDRRVRKGLIRRHRARADRREVLALITPAGRQVIVQATDRRRALLCDILGRLPAGHQAAVAPALAVFAAAAGEVPLNQWPEKSEERHDGRILPRAGRRVLGGAWNGANA